MIYKLVRQWMRYRLGSRTHTHTHARLRAHSHTHIHTQTQGEAERNGGTNGEMKGAEKERRNPRPQTIFDLLIAAQTTLRYRGENGGPDQAVGFFTSSARLKST